jgi:hypothetical protein
MSNIAFWIAEGLTAQDTTTIGAGARTALAGSTQKSAP